MGFQLSIMQTKSRDESIEEEEYRRLASRLVEAAVKRGLEIALLRLLVEREIEHSIYVDAVARRRHVEFEDLPDDRTLKASLPEMNFNQLVGLLVEVCFREDSYPGKTGDYAKRLLEMYNIKQAEN